MLGCWSDGTTPLLHYSTTPKAMRVSVILLVFIILLPLSIFAEPEFNGYVRQHTALRAVPDQRHDLMVLEHKLHLESRESRGHASFFASVDLTIDQHDAALNPYLHFREAYIDFSKGGLDLRLGKQVVMWGNADGVFITDVVTPKDLSRFLLPDFEDIRMSIPMLKANYYIGELGLETVLIPRFIASVQAASGDWAFEKASLTAWIPTTMPEASASNAEFGLKVSGLALETDFSVLYLHTWDDFPSVEWVTASLPDSLTPYLPLAQSFGVSIPEIKTPSLRHSKLNIVGLTFSRPVSSLVLRGEGACYLAVPFAGLEPAPNLAPNADSLTARIAELATAYGIPQTAAQDSIVAQLATITKALSLPDSVPGAMYTKHYLYYMLGTDYAGIRNTTISFQFVQKAILAYDPDEGLISMTGRQQSQFENMISLVLNVRLLQERLVPKSLLLYSITDGDFMFRPSIEYNLADGLWLFAGMDLLEGDPGTMFGQFDDNDNVYVKVKYSF